MSQMIQIIALVNPDGKVVSFKGEAFDGHSVASLRDRLEFIKDVFRQVVNNIDQIDGDRLDNFEKRLSVLETIYSEPTPQPTLDKITSIAPQKFKRVSDGLTLVPLAKVLALADCAHSLTELREELRQL